MASEKAREAVKKFIRVAFDPEYAGMADACAEVMIAAIVEAEREAARRDLPDTGGWLEMDSRRGEPSQGEGQHDSPTWPYVLAFAEAMEEKLAANRHKGDREGWLKDSPEALFARLEEETRELLCVLESSYILSKTKVLHEAADVANFAMMIADVCGGLDVRPEPSGGKG